MALTLHRARREPNVIDDTRSAPATGGVAATEAVPVTHGVHRERVFERPTGAALTGTVAVLAGAWAALAPYIGPYFDYRPTSTATWDGNLNNGLLHLLPGAVAVAAGLMLLGMGPARRNVRGGSLLIPGLMLAAAGAWLVVGPTAWPTFESGATFLGGVSPLRNLLNVGCASLAPGLLLALLGGMAMKAGTVPMVSVDDPLTPAEARSERTETAAADTTPAAAEERTGMVRTTDV